MNDTHQRIEPDPWPLDDVADPPADDHIEPPPLKGIRRTAARAACFVAGRKRYAVPAALGAGALVLGGAAMLTPNVGRVVAIRVAPLVLRVAPRVMAWAIGTIGIAAAIALPFRAWASSPR